MPLSSTASTIKEPGVKKIINDKIQRALGFFNFVEKRTIAGFKSLLDRKIQDPTCKTAHRKSQQKTTSNWNADIHRFIVVPLSSALGTLFVPTETPEPKPVPH
ncbi:hypothetical protein D3C87_1898140 [compost metagenome]